MQGTSVLFGQIAVVFGIVIAGVWGATQWTAAALGYQLRLGSPWFDLLGTPIYHPWRLFEWWFFFDAYAPRVFDTGGAIAGGSGLLAVVVAIGMSIWRSRQSRLVTTYGSARWANADDIRKAGLTLPAARPPVPSPRRPGTRPDLCAYAIGQGCRPRGADTAFLACIRRRPRHQRRELADHRRLALALLSLPAVQPHGCEVGGLQPAAGGAARRA